MELVSYMGRYCVSWHGFVQCGNEWWHDVKANQAATPLTRLNPGFLELDELSHPNITDIFYRCSVGVFFPLVCK